MDNKTLTNTLARRTDSDPKLTAELLSALATIVREKSCDLDSIALPGLGSLVAMKRAERVTLDPATGRKTLVPPEIKLEFVAGSQLKKRIAHE